MPLTIVIPVAKEDDSYRNMLDHLKLFPTTTEIIFAGDVDKEIVEKHLPSYQCVFSMGSEGRAIQMNRAARLASHEWILFLHCDSRFKAKYVRKVLECCKKNEDCLYYGYLKFFDANYLIKLNEIGANYRSRLWSLPFGDQSFLVQKSTFFRLGAFNSETSMGEDHDFIWKLKKKNIAIVPLEANIESSARKYYDKGWFHLSFKYFYLTWKKVFIELWKIGLKK